MKTTRVLRTLLIGALLCSCKARPPVPTGNGRLASGMLARVADQSIPIEQVSRIAAAQGISERSALDRATADALFAVEARRSIGSPSVRQAERAAAARSLLEELARHAQSQGTPTDKEIEQLTIDHWIDWDRPPAARVVHVVALLPSNGEARASREVAERVQAAVHGVRAPEVFAERARGVPHQGIELRVEELPFITPDGRGISIKEPRMAAGQFEPAFAAAANALSTEGDQSPIVETRFGFHVLMLLERLPERRLPLEERRRIFEPEVLARRARSEKNTLVQRLGAEAQVGVARDVDAQTETLFR
ncbi:MAG TPA: peptidylprolyl isomerase [Polyangiaceae bacterium]|nr:peptidylprolyl isomerase [Polyangiaceae bacterium]